MTTIAYDGRTLAADTRYSEGPHFYGHIHKLRLLPNGSVMGYAGHVGVAAKIADILAKKQKISEKLTKKELSKIQILLVDRDNTLYYLDEAYGDLLPSDESVLAIGSGAEIAVALMRLGFPASDAIKGVAKTHATTNDLVDSYDLATKAFTLADFPG